MTDITDFCFNTHPHAHQRWREESVIFAVNDVNGKNSLWIQMQRLFVESSSHYYLYIPAVRDVFYASTLIAPSARLLSP